MDFKEYSELFHAERGRRKSYSSRPTPNRKQNPGGSRPTAPTSITPRAEDRLLFDRFNRLCNAMFVSPENDESSKFVKSLNQRLKKCKQHDTGNPNATNIMVFDYTFDSDPSLRDDLRNFINRYEPLYRKANNPYYTNSYRPWRF